MARRAGVALAVAVGAAFTLGGPDRGGPTPSAAQEEDEGLGSAAPAEARAVVARAIEAMGGFEALSALRTAALTIEADANAVQERHVLKLAGRHLHYASRQPSGAGFDVVLAGAVGFLCDRRPDGSSTYSEDLAPADVQEGAYERDVLFMPLLLGQLLVDPRSGLEHKGRNSVGEVVVKATVPPAAEQKADPFIVRLKFDPASRRLTGVMGAIPLGAEAGRKRYVTFDDWRQVGPVHLPHRLVDARNPEAPPREIRVTWALDPALDPNLFSRPATTAGSAAPPGPSERGR